MGEVSSVLDADIASRGTADDATAAPSVSVADGDIRGSAAVPLRVIATVTAAAVAIGAGIVGGLVTVDRARHDEAASRASSARSLAVAATTAQRAARVVLEDSASAALALHDAVTAQVLPHQDLLGGAAALAPVVEAQESMSVALEAVYGTADTDAASRIVVTAPMPSPPPVDPRDSTESLRATVADFRAIEGAALSSRDALAEDAVELDEAAAAVHEGLAALAGTVPGVKDALVAAHGHASADAQAAASAAATALAAAPADADLPALLAAYAAAAATVISTHDAEVARIAAEEAARAAEAAKAAARRTGGGSASSRGGSSGGGSVTGGAPTQGVLSETNAARANNGLGALSWNGTLASRSCAFAAELASVNGGLYHSSFPGGFSGWAENVAVGYGSPAAVVAGWMGSSGHRANILGNYTVMGACSSTSATGRIYWVQQFGR